jgi:hypothetical protein
MKYIITESQMDRAVLKYLNSEYGDLEPYETDKHPNHIFFMKDGEVIFDYNKKNGVVIFSYDKIWSFLQSFFGLEYEEIQDLTKEWVEEHYKLGVSTTIYRQINEISRWRNITN